MPDLLPFPGPESPRLFDPASDPDPTPPASAQAAVLLPLPAVAPQLPSGRKFRRLCRHCELQSGCRPRGLCGGCYRDRAVRALYPSAAAKAPRPPLTPAQRRLALSPCPHEPLTARRLHVERLRVRLGLPVWLDGDARRGDREPSREEELRLRGAGLSRWQEDRLPPREARELRRAA